MWIWDMVNFKMVKEHVKEHERSVDWIWKCYGIAMDLTGVRGAMMIAAMGKKRTTSFKVLHSHALSIFENLRSARSADCGDCGLLSKAAEYEKSWLIIDTLSTSSRTSLLTRFTTVTRKFFSLFSSAEFHETRVTPVFSSVMFCFGSAFLFGAAAFPAISRDSTNSKNSASVTAPSLSEAIWMIKPNSLR